MVFVSPSEEKKSSRTEGLLPATTIREIIDDLRIKHCGAFFEEKK